MPAHCSTRTPSRAAPPPVPAERLLGSVWPPAPRGPGRFERSFRRQVAGQIRDVLTRGYVLRYSALLHSARKRGVTVEHLLAVYLTRLVMDKVDREYL